MFAFSARQTRRFPASFFIRLHLILLPAFAASSCSTLGYYGQAISGHLGIMSKSQPINLILQEEAADEALLAKLREVQQLVRFAAHDLGLRTGKNFTRYADIGRRYAVWNLVAAEEFSMEPRIWCFPIAGCVSYRGYFREAAARRHAERLKNRRYEVSLGGVAAYSTLGYFADPVLSSFIDYSPSNLAAVLLHELAHRQLYLPGDSRFNEGFATALEQIAMQRYLLAKGLGEDYAKYLQDQSAETAFFAFLADWKQSFRELYALYPEVISAEEARHRKAELHTRLRHAYEVFRVEQNTGSRFDGWMSGINNAKIAGIATYRDYVPGFIILYKSCNEQLDCWLQQAEALTQLSAEERARLLTRGAGQN